MSDLEISPDIEELGENESIDINDGLKTIINLLTDLKKQNLEQSKIYSGLTNAEKDIKLLVKKFSAKDNAIGEIVENNNKVFTKNVEELDLMLHAFNKIPNKIDEKIIKIIPEIAKKIVESHGEEMTGFRKNINACNNELNFVRENAARLQTWHAKRTAVITLAAIFISIISSSAGIYLILQKYPPKHETSIQKVNHVHANEKVYVFDATGKFCGRAKIDRSK